MRLKEININLMHLNTMESKINFRGTLSLNTKAHGDQFCTLKHVITAQLVSSSLAHNLAAFYPVVWQIIYFKKSADVSIKSKLVEMLLSWRPRFSHTSACRQIMRKKNQYWQHSITQTKEINRWNIVFELQFNQGVMCLHVTRGNRNLESLSYLPVSRRL